ncbi:S8 family serine peptidase (plasmid) [Mesorhizobium atlanticum]|uniref:S8 family serine peptidase n=1 Tax=Mesorhizobium atlanticum TaxID=2233532 RepID=UPI003704B002
MTVGSLAHGNGLDARLGAEVAVRPITQEGEPSSFTRAGPGVEGSVKPDFIDLGGTMIVDPLVQRLRDGRDVASAGLLTLHHRPIEQLITSGSGTSYAAPIVAFKAAQVLSRFPEASANLVRALLATSATVPEAAHQRLSSLGEDAIRNVCGYGQINLEHAAFSDDARVALYAEDELAMDHFAIYELPVPALFQSTNGRRRIRISLAYDPPVRHSRNDYAGVGMEFPPCAGMRAGADFGTLSPPTARRGGPRHRKSIPVQDGPRAAIEGEEHAPVGYCDIQDRHFELRRSLLHRRSMRSRVGDGARPPTVCHRRAGRTRSRDSNLPADTPAYPAPRLSR